MATLLRPMPAHFVRIIDYVSALLEAAGPRVWRQRELAEVLRADGAPTLSTKRARDAVRNLVNWGVLFEVRRGFRRDGTVYPPLYTAPQFADDLGVLARLGEDPDPDAPVSRACADARRFQHGQPERVYHQVESAVARWIGVPREQWTNVEHSRCTSALCAAYRHFMRADLAKRDRIEEPREPVPLSVVEEIASLLYPLGQQAEPADETGDS